MKQTAIVGCLVFSPAAFAFPMVRYTLTVDGGSASAIAPSFVATSTTFVPPILSGASENGAPPSLLKLNVPSNSDPLNTFGVGLYFTDGASYLANNGLQLTWLNHFGTYQIPVGLFGDSATFTTSPVYVTNGGTPEPASLAALGLGVLAVLRRSTSHRNADK